ncbi:MAG: hypothetical protein ACOCYU_02115 [Brevefilum sp.]
MAQQYSLPWGDEELTFDFAGINARPSTFNMVGQPIEENPMRHDLEEAVQML